MSRLTKSIKADIISVVEARCITDKENALKERITDFCKHVFWQQIDKQTYQTWKTLPKGLSHGYCIGRIFVKDETLGRLESSYVEEYHPLNMNSYIYYKDLNEEQRAEFKVLIRELDDHDAYVKQVMDSLHSVLSSVTTIKKLREVWVNGADIIDKALGMSQQSPTVYMPMLAVSQLDALVPLP